MITQPQISQKAVQLPSLTPVQTGLLQRQCACGQHTDGGECEECRQEHEGTIQRAAVSAPPVNNVPPIVYEVLNSPGQPLDAGTRVFMEQRFGHDFSGVRVHACEKAAASARAVNAMAYTVGRDIVFGKGSYTPGTMKGKRLMAHELTHVMQQQETIGSVQGKLTVSQSKSIYEQEAEQAANTLVPDTSPSPGLKGAFIAAPSNVLFPYRPRGSQSPNYGVDDTDSLKEAPFTNKEIQPWIRRIYVKFDGTKPDDQRDLVPTGRLSASYEPNKAALPSTDSFITGGKTRLGLTTKGDHKVTRIEGAGYNDLPLPAPIRVGPRYPEYKYVKPESLESIGSSMYFAIFFYDHEAIHLGDLNNGSHGCVHVDDDDTMQQINYHSVKDRTMVDVSYDSSVLKKVCCDQMRNSKGGKSQKPAKM